MQGFFLKRSRIPPDLGVPTVPNTMRTTVRPRLPPKSTVPTFAYIAVDPAGSRVRGELAGPSEAAVLAELESRKLTPVDVSLAGASTAGPRPLPIRQLAAAYIQLADLLRAGVPLMRSLRILAGRKGNPRFAAVFSELAEAVASGEDLGEAMARRPTIFPPVHVAMVRAGERGAFLESVLSSLGKLVLGQAELRSQVVGSLFYPVILLVVGTLIVSGIFIFFVPMFRSVYDGMEGGLPLITRIVFGLSEMLSRAWYIVIPVLIAAAAALRVALKTPAAKDAYERLRTHAWLIGPITRSLATARVCRMLGTMLHHSVPLLTALSIAKDAAGNAPMQAAVAQATEAVRSGKPLTGPLETSGLFEPDVIEMIAVGEQANNLDSVLTTIADTIESRVERLLSTALRLVEPILLLVLGGMVAVIAAALILPLLRMSTKL